MSHIMRYALVTNARNRREAEIYLPDNYAIVHADIDIERPLRSVYVIAGRDAAGWTLDYLTQRYASGLLSCKEIDLSHPIMRRVPS